MNKEPLAKLESTGCDVDTHLKKQLICFSLQVENEKKRPEPRGLPLQKIERLGEMERPTAISLGLILSGEGTLVRGISIFVSPIYFFGKDP